MLQVRTNPMCTRISFFVSKEVREITAFFLFMTNIQLKRVSHKLSRRTTDAPSIGSVHKTISGPEKSLVEHSLVEKKAIFVDIESFSQEATNLKKLNMTDLENDLQRPRLRRSTIDRRRRT